MTYACRRCGWRGWRTRCIVIHAGVLIALHAAACPICGHDCRLARR